jgi:hypothetical protein
MCCQSLIYTLICCGGDDYDDCVDDGDADVANDDEFGGVNDDGDGEIFFVVNIEATFVNPEIWLKNR